MIFDLILALTLPGQIDLQFFFAKRHAMASIFCTQSLLKLIPVQPLNNVGEIDPRTICLWTLCITPTQKVEESFEETKILGKVILWFVLSQPYKRKLVLKNEYNSNKFTNSTIPQLKLLWFNRKIMSFLRTNGTTELPERAVPKSFLPNFVNFLKSSGNQFFKGYLG